MCLCSAFATTVEPSCTKLLLSHRVSVNLTSPMEKVSLYEDFFLFLFLLKLTV